MFGRKQPAFTFENRRLEEEALAAQSDVIADTKGQERIDLPFGEPTPPPVEPPKATTPRPDPSSLFPRHDEIEPKVATATSPLLQLGTEETVEQAAPVAAPAQPKRRAGRAKTRLLGIDHGDGKVEDVIGAQEQQKASAPLTYHAVGWLVVVEGPGRGHSMPLRTGVSQLGRGDDQSVQLDFGDTSISRDNHASIAFDEERRGFYIGHGGKANLVRLNNAPVLSTELVVNGDLIRIGETTLQLVAFCGEDFAWSDVKDAEAASEPVVDEAPAVEEAPAEEEAPVLKAVPQPTTVEKIDEEVHSDTLEFGEPASRARGVE